MALTIYEDSNDYRWPSEVSLDDPTQPPNNSKQPQQFLLEVMNGSSNEVFVCPTDPTPADYHWQLNGFMSHEGFPDDACSYMFNIWAWNAYMRNYNKIFYRSIIDKPSEWLEVGDGKRTFAARSNWRMINPTNDVLFVDWWHPRWKISGLYGDGHVTRVNALTADSITTDPTDY